MWLLETKMIATVALNRHFEWGNLVLRSLPPDTAINALPEEWWAEITVSERSLRRCLIGEWEFASKVLNVDLHDAALHGETNSMVQRALAWLLAPFYQPQATLNQYADLYSRMAARLDAPIRGYSVAIEEASALSATHAEQAFPPRSMYNFIGSMMMGVGLSDLGV